MGWRKRWTTRLLVELQSSTLEREKVAFTCVFRHTLIMECGTSRVEQ